MGACGGPFKSMGGSTEASNGDLAMVSSNGGGRSGAPHAKEPHGASATRSARNRRPTGERNNSHASRTRPGCWQRTRRVSWSFLNRIVATFYGGWLRVQRAAASLAIARRSPSAVAQALLGTMATAFAVGG